MKLFNYDSPFWSFMSRLADLIILNLLWIVFCIPVVTIGASTTAMYRVTLNMVRGEGSLVMAALNLLPVALFLFATSFFFRTAIFWVLIGSALVAFANSWLLRKVFKKNFGLD